MQTYAGDPIPVKSLKDKFAGRTFRIEDLESFCASLLWCFSSF